MRSAHFVVTSNAETDRVRAVTRELEGVRAAWPRLAGRASEPVGGAVSVLAVTDEGSLREALPQYWERRGRRPAGAYWNGAHQPRIVLRMDGPDDARVGRVFHEYAHLVTHEMLAEPPAWLDEGLSEIWGSARVDDAGVAIGWPVRDHLNRLRRSRAWFPIDELLTMSEAPDASNPNELLLFYAQSWALAHYMLLGDADAPWAGAEGHPYVRRLRSGFGSLEAAEQTFGDLAALEESLKAYVEQGLFRTLRVEAGNAGKGASDTRVRMLAPAEALAVRAGFLVDGERPAAAVPLLAEALRFEPGNAAALETRGVLAFRQNQPTEAARWFDRAIETGSASHVAFYYRAVLDGPAPTGGMVERHLQQALALEPTFAPAYARLADFYGQDPLRALDGVPLLRRAVALAPREASYWMSLGRLLTSVNRPEEALAAGRAGLEVAGASSASRERLGAFVGDMAGAAAGK